MKKLPFVVTAVAVIAGSAALAQQKSTVPPGVADAAIKAAFPGAPEQFIPRLSQDETMKQCSASHNNPSKEIADAIQKRELATIEYPADGKFIGDWKKGEALAQNGYGMRFSDYPPTRANGGNCYACHQIIEAGSELRHARPEPVPVRQAARLQGSRREGDLRENI